MYRAFSTRSATARAPVCFQGVNDSEWTHHLLAELFHTCAPDPTHGAGKSPGLLTVKIDSLSVFLVLLHCQTFLDIVTGTMLSAALERPDQ